MSRFSGQQCGECGGGAGYNHSASCSRAGKGAGVNACGQCGEPTATTLVWLPPNEPGQPELPVRKCHRCWAEFLKRVEAAIALGEESPCPLR